MMWQLPPSSLLPALCSMPMVALNSFWLPFVQYKALFYWWLQIALGVGVAAAVSMFVTPITAGAACGVHRGPLPCRADSVIQRRTSAPWHAAPCLPGSCLAAGVVQGMHSATGKGCTQ